MYGIVAAVLVIYLVYFSSALYGNVSGLVILNLEQNSHECVSISSTTTVSVQRAVRGISGSGSFWSPPPINSVDPVQEEESRSSMIDNIPSYTIQEDDTGTVIEDIPTESVQEDDTSTVIEDVPNETTREHGSRNTIIDNSPTEPVQEETIQEEPVQEEPTQEEIPSNDSSNDSNYVQPTNEAQNSDGILLAGWRSSMYGYQQEQPPSYWINVANDISSKFPGTTPGGIWLVGETDGSGPGTILYMPSSGSYQNIKFEGGDASESYLTAFDNAGVKVILQVEPMDADINTLIDIVMNRYKNHPSVIGFGVDIEWYGTCRDGCKPTAAEVTSWYNHLHTIDPNYILMIKHFEESKLPTGIPSDILIVCDDEQNGNLKTLVSEHVAFENHFQNNPFGAQYGYPSDENIWGGMQDPVKQVGDDIQDAIGKPISLFWVDFSIHQLYS